MRSRIDDGESVDGRDRKRIQLSVSTPAPHPLIRQYLRASPSVHEIREDEQIADMVRTAKGTPRHDDIHGIFQEPEADLRVAAHVKPVAEEIELPAVLRGASVQDVVFVR